MLRDLRVKLLALLEILQSSNPEGGLLGLDEDWKDGGECKWIG